MANAAIDTPKETYGDGSPAFVGFPTTKYHPVLGKQEAHDPNEAAALFQPPHNWFETAGQADMARTDREAQQVIVNNLRIKIDSKNAVINGGEPIPLVGDGAPKGIVRNSVQAQESVDAGKAEPL